MKLIDFSPGPIPIVFGAPLTPQEADYIRGKQFKKLKELIARNDGEPLAGTPMVVDLVKKNPWTMTEKQLVCVSINYGREWLATRGGNFHKHTEMEILLRGCWANLEVATSEIIPLDPERLEFMKNKKK